MGILYRAQQRSLRRVVALKVLPPAMPADPVAVERFRREVAALARTDHPNVVKILTYGVDADRHYFAMEFVEGADLAHAAKWLSQWKSSGSTLNDGHLAAAVSRRESPVDGASAHGAGEQVQAPDHWAQPFFPRAHIFDQTTYPPPGAVFTASKDLWPRFTQAGSEVSTLLACLP